MDKIILPPLAFKRPFDFELLQSCRPEFGSLVSVEIYDIAAQLADNEVMALGLWTWVPFSTETSDVNWQTYEGYPYHRSEFEYIFTLEDPLTTA